MIYRVLHNKKGREKSLPNFELFPRIELGTSSLPSISKPTILDGKTKSFRSMLQCFATLSHLYYSCTLYNNMYNITPRKSLRVNNVFYCKCTKHLRSTQCCKWLFINKVRLVFIYSEMGEICEYVLSRFVYFSPIQYNCTQSPLCLYVYRQREWGNSSQTAAIKHPWE